MYKTLVEENFPEVLFPWVIDKLYLIRYNINMKEIIYYKLKNGKCPYLDWYNSLDKSIKLVVDRRIDRLKLGNFGIYKKFENLTELKFKQGAGYRIYTFEVDDIVIILLVGGDKSTQTKDIKLAKTYLEELKERYK